MLQGTIVIDGAAISSQSDGDNDNAILQHIRLGHMGKKDTVKL